VQDRHDADQNAPRSSAGPRLEFIAFSPPDRDEYKTCCAVRRSARRAGRAGRALHLCPSTTVQYVTSSQNKNTEDLGGPECQMARSLIQHVACCYCSALALCAEDRALVLDARARPAAVDLRTGRVTQGVPTAGCLRSYCAGGRRRLALLDHGPYKQTVCCHLQPKGPMIATFFCTRRHIGAEREC